MPVPIVSFAVGSLNQYTQTTLAATGVPTAAFCYDRNGNLTADGSSVYLYDIENRLVERRVQGTGNTNCANLSYGGTVLASLRYDPMGRLYEVVGTVSGTIRFLNDGDAMVGEYDDTTTGGTGTLLQRYVHGADGQADDPIARYAGSQMNNGTLWFLHADRQGSINATADTYGNLARLFKYDEYGLPQSSDATPLTAANGARFLYTGQAWIPDLGMYYYKARIYSPTLGRFLQTDPIGYEDQVNLYAYVGGDPVSRTDPTGMFANCSEDPTCGYIKGGPSDQNAEMEARTVRFLPVENGSEGERHVRPMIVDGVNQSNLGRLIAVLNKTIQNYTSEKNMEAAYTVFMTSEGNYGYTLDFQTARVSGAQEMSIQSYKGIEPIFIAHTHATPTNNFGSIFGSRQSKPGASDWDAKQGKAQLLQIAPGATFYVFSRALNPGGRDRWTPHKY